MERLAVRIQAMLTEYSELRQEIRTAFQSQFTTITVVAAALGLLFSLGIDMTSSDKNVSPAAVAFLFCALIPSTSMVTGIIWLDQACRVARIGIYMRNLERKVNRVLGVESDRDDAALYWEQWVQTLSQGKGLLQRVHHYAYYVCITLFCLIPIVSAVFGLYLVNWAWHSAVLSLIISGATYAAFIAFLITYIKSISHYWVKALPDREAEPLP